MKEKKVKVHKALRAALGAAFAATEAADLIEAIWSAIPPQYRRRCWSPTCMMQDVAEYGRFIDWNEALMNVLRNHFEDAVLGRLFATFGGQAVRDAVGATSFGQAMYGVN